MRFYSEEDTASFDAVTFRFIQTHLDGHVFRIVLNRPEKRNAFTLTMAEEIAYALAYAHYSKEVRCLLLSARGPVFCAGADLNAFHDPASDLVNPTLPRPSETVRLGDAFAGLLKPSIAQVEGAVLAGGFLMICGCTFVISVPEAQYSLPEVKRGIWPMQVMASLDGLISGRKIMEMAITGRAYSAAEALEMGLITQVVTHTEIQDTAEELAKLITSQAPLAIQEGMRAYADLHEMPSAERQGMLQQRLNTLLLSADAKEGVRAFREKRRPEWKGE
ncbi:enoyl-CoA hydratase/isomerase family protein [Dyadobacter tibetensis]|uniref:enoyl-CoA hydratase/isomerase family protein n=1 Tax=Dyadobacter tibetensis TaxID=1211851 RepID=UPI00047210CB|nr:enoyl-CoA hydratase-related protein [Dyadobacter tibetensis]